MYENDNFSGYETGDENTTPAFNFLGDSLRDAFDPKHAGRERS